MAVLIASTAAERQTDPKEAAAGSQTNYGNDYSGSGPAVRTEFCAGFFAAAVRSTFLSAKRSRSKSLPRSSCFQVASVFL